MSNVDCSTTYIGDIQEVQAEGQYDDGNTVV